MAEIRVCTLSQLNRTKEVQADLDHLYRHRQTQPIELAVAQLCMNDQDAAAKTYIAMLRDPKNRATALKDLQTYSDKGLAPYSRTLRQRKYAVRARRDVEAALAAVGRTYAYDLAAN